MGVRDRRVAAKVKFRNPKVETRKKAEYRNPKWALACPRCVEQVPSVFGLRTSAFFRPSGFGFRISYWFRISYLTPLQHLPDIPREREESRGVRFRTPSVNCGIQNRLQQFQQVAQIRFLDRAGFQTKLQRIGVCRNAHRRYFE